MNNASKKKKEQLGMSHGAASNKLKKQLMFNMAKKLDMNYCFQCGAEIETSEELSIEHKIPWLDSDDPKGLFFDINNIAFSHLKCNSGASRKNFYLKALEERGNQNILKGTKVCKSCNQELPLSDFYKDKNTADKYRTMCKKCMYEYRKNKGER